MRTIRWISWLLVVVITGITIAVMVSDDVRHALLGGPGEQAGVADIGGPFTLVDHTGATVTEQDFLGKPSLYFFGFTHCPDVCPTTLYELTRWLGELGPDADRLNAAFVTVDPERDTPQAMADYVSAFDPHIVGLTGTPEQVAAMAGEWRAYYRRVEQEGGDYTMDHSALIYLMDAEGRFVGTIAFSEADETALGKLRRLIDGA